jgi:citrate synthase
MQQIVDLGLERTIAAETVLSDVRGLDGELVIRGYGVDDFAARKTFEETLYLLWNGDFPDERQLERFGERLRNTRAIPNRTTSVIVEAVGSGASPMDVLRVAFGTLDTAEVGTTPDCDEAIGIVSRTATIVATAHRLRNGLQIIQPDDRLSHSANFLYMLRGEEPPDEHVRALDTYLNTVVDHGLNASTFTARVVASTASDLVSAITAAIGALKGPLHGGAPGPALDMVFEIGSVERAEPAIRARLERGERLMGFGHRVYKVRDPRADVLAEGCKRLYESGAGDEELYRLAVDVEAIALRLLEEYKPGRNLQTNVEYYTALLLHSLGFDTELFTPTFAASRVGGWIAHCVEQRELGRLIRPGSRYVGEVGRRFAGSISR